MDNPANAAVSADVTQAMQLVRNKYPELLQKREKMEQAVAEFDPSSGEVPPPAPHRWVLFTKDVVIATHAAQVELYKQAQRMRLKHDQCYIRQIEPALLRWAEGVIDVVEYNPNREATEAKPKF